MRQLIARVDDDLHARLKDVAAEHGWSLNTLVVRVLEDAVAGEEAGRARVRARAGREGRLVSPPRPVRVPSWQTVARATRGAGTAASDALAAERATR